LTKSRNVKSEEQVAKVAAYNCFLFERSS